MRTGLALFLLLAVTGAGPAPSLPVPPIPPEHPPAAQSAPIPNPDARAPLDTSSAGTHNVDTPRAVNSEYPANNRPTSAPIVISTNDRRLLTRAGSRQDPAFAS